jgi:hypothetical protein
MSSRRSEVVPDKVIDALRARERDGICRHRRFLDLHPLLGAAGAIRRAEPLGHNALAAEEACRVLENPAW